MRLSIILIFLSGFLFLIACNDEKSEVPNLSGNWVLATDAEFLDDNDVFSFCNNSEITDENGDKRPTVYGVKIDSHRNVTLLENSYAMGVIASNGALIPSKQLVESISNSEEKSHQECLASTEPTITHIYQRDQLLSFYLNVKPDGLMFRSSSTAVHCLDRKIIKEEPRKSELLLTKVSAVELDELKHLNQKYCIDEAEHIPGITSCIDSCTVKGDKGYDDCETSCVQTLKSSNLMN